MYDDGTLKLEWNAHLLRQKTRDESCKDITTTGSDNTDDVGNKDSTDVNQNRRYLAKSGSVLETNYEVREESLTLRQMVCAAVIIVHPLHVYHVAYIISHFLIYFCFIIEIQRLAHS
jgi:hypothetical protein